MVIVMKQEKGIVNEVYLLENDENLIGFKVSVDENNIDIVVRQTEDNANIYKNDEVLVISDIVNGKIVYDIMLDEDDSNE